MVVVVWLCVAMAVLLVVVVVLVVMVMAVAVVVVVVVVVVSLCAVVLGGTLVSWGLILAEIYECHVVVAQSHIARPHCCA